MVIEPLAKVPQGVIPAGFLGRNPGFKVPGPRPEACRGDGIRDFCKRLHWQG